MRAVFAVAMVMGGFVLGACPSATPSPTVPTAPSDSSTVATPAPSPEPTPSETTAAPSTSASTIMPIGKTVKSPIFSDDSCNQDTECAPVAMCHANKCAALANVGTMKPGMMCTMDCRGGTVDCGFNHCGCVASPSGAKKCALLAGPKP